jgi:hypothetical protein
MLLLICALFYAQKSIVPLSAIDEAEAVFGQFGQSS